MLAAPLAGADDWPQWLGPKRDSVWRETGVLRELPQGGPIVKWRTPINGGYAGPAVAGGRVFVMDYVTDGDQTPNPDHRNQLEGTERVLCLAADDGRQLWEYPYDCPYHISYPAGPRTTPTVSEGKVYALGAEGNLSCLDAESGALVWRRDLKEEYGVEAPQWGFSGHPLIEGDTLFCLVGGEGSVAVALDKATGQERWRALTAAEPGYAPPTMIEAAGKRQLLIWHPESLNGLDPETGQVYWSVPLQPDFKMAIATPRQLGDYVFVGAIKSKSMLVQLAQDKPGAELVWLGSPKRGIGPSHATPFAEDGHLYGVDGYGDLVCVELSSGERLWETFALMPDQRRAGSGTVFLVKNDDRFFLASDSGELVIARLSPRGYEEVSRSGQILEPTGDAFGRSVVWSHPAFADRCMFWRNDKELVCVSLAAE
jgi:hypothetical protein